MEEIKILKKLPTVLTKDSTFTERIPKGDWKEGQIIILPEDAILVLNDEEGR